MMTTSGLLAITSSASAQLPSLFGSAKTELYGGVTNVFDKDQPPELRLFGKPESFARRRMGVALASGDSVETARIRAKQAAAKVKPVIPQ